MPVRSSTGKVFRFEPRVIVLIGAILVAGALGESGMDWRKCGSGASDLISACALGIDVLPETVRSALMETENG